jgi:hypothetical protein
MARRYRLPARYVGRVGLGFRASLLPRLGFFWIRPKRRAAERGRLILLSRSLLHSRNNSTKSVFGHDPRINL